MIVSVFPQTVRRPAMETVLYLLAPFHKGQLRDPAPQLLRGDPDLVASLIDGCEYKNPRTFGVLSWHPDDEVTPEQEQEVMDEFMAAAFPGIPNRLRPPVLFVRHKHTENGHHEIHFLLPRMLMSERSRYYDIKPPINTGQGHTLNKRWDAFCDYFDKKHNWRNPREYRSLRQVVIPDYFKKDLSKENQKREEFRKDLYEDIHFGANNGAFDNREEVIQAIKNLGIKIARVNEKTISVYLPGTKTSVRLRGAAMREDYAGYFHKEIDPEKIAEFEKHNPKSVEEAEARYLAMLDKTAKQNRERYRVVLEEEAKLQAQIVEPPPNIRELASQISTTLDPDQLQSPANENSIDVPTTLREENQYEIQTELPDRNPADAGGNDRTDREGAINSLEAEFNGTTQRSRVLGEQFEDLRTTRQQRGILLACIASSVRGANRELQVGQLAYQKLCNRLDEACRGLPNITRSRQRQHGAMEHFADGLQQQIRRAGSKIRRIANYTQRFAIICNGLSRGAEARLKILINKMKLQRRPPQRQRDIDLDL